MTKPNKILQLNLENEAIKLKAKGLGVRLIARELTRITGTKISHNSVWNFLRLNNNIVGTQLAKNEDYKNRLAKSYFDVIEELVALGLKIREEIDQNSDNWRAHTKFMGLYLKHIGLSTKIMDIKIPTEIKQEVSTQEIQNVILQEFARLVKEGEIDIKTGRLSESFRQQLERLCY